MSNLLVVDFDFFFPNPMEAGDADRRDVGLYDWGHNETPIMLSNVIWVSRAASFLSFDMPLPTVQPPKGGWMAFWDRFRFTDDAAMFYADSNRHAGRLSPDLGASGEAWETVQLFDAHHDSGYQVPSMQEWLTRGTFSCEDWMLVHQVRGCTDLTVRYPQWKSRGLNEPLPSGALTKQIIDDGQPVETVFDMIFACRSGAWVPSWCDPDFLDFLDACPIDGIQVDDLALDREFQHADAEEHGEQVKAFRALADATDAARD